MKEGAGGICFCVKKNSVKEKKRANYVMHTLVEHVFGAGGIRFYVS